MIATAWSIQEQVHTCNYIVGTLCLRRRDALVFQVNYYYYTIIITIIIIIMIIILIIIIYHFIILL